MLHKWMRSKPIRRIFLISLGAAAVIYPMGAIHSEEVVRPAAVSADGRQLAVSGGYGSYLNSHQSAGRPDVRIIVEGESYSGAEGMQAAVVDNAAYDGQSGQSLLTEESGSVDWEVVIEQEGLYNIGIHYYALEGKSSAVEREFRIDGEVPFRGSDRLVFPRIWVNEKEKIERDRRGNDLRPRQKEQPDWQFSPFKASDGYYNQPYLFYLTEGKHTLSLHSLREPVLIDRLEIFQEKEAPDYEAVVQQYRSEGYKETEGVRIKVQAEDAVSKSDPTLYPLNDRSSPATEPYDVSKIRINIIGGNNWRMPNQRIAWKVEVPEDGLYQIALKSRQNILRGVYSTRKLTVDGEVPFREAENLQFNYNGKWVMDVLGGKEPYLFYLSKGTHELALEVTLGDIAELLREVEASVLELNALYRKILMITGSSPDTLRDYELDKQIPGLTDVLRKESDRLSGVAGTLQRVTGEKSDKAAILNTTAYQLRDMAERPDSIARRLDRFKTNVGGLGTWMLEVKEQPLELDYLLLSSPGSKLPQAEASWFRSIGHELSAFYHSFFENYDAIGDVPDAGAVEVWIGTGRDQAQVLKSMIDDTFTAKTGIKVNLKLVQMGMLLPATLAHKGPDVAMQLGSDIPVNYGMRKASYDLTNFPDYEEVAKRFRESAIVPFTYIDGVYALPEQQTFSMLFYRKDIFDELNLKAPETWDDVRKLIPVLQKKHMDFGLPAETLPNQMFPNHTFAMLLYQNGGSFYKRNGAASDLDSDIAVKAFKRWSEFYTSYKLPLQFDFVNRFRTGEMPIGIADYTLYNQLAVFAPEIMGLWDFVPVPGTKQADGSIRRDAASTESAVMMLNNAEDKEAAWFFMKWWTDKDTQVRFGREMEGLMGAAARYPTANIEALKELPWPVKDYDHLTAQWEWVRGIPEVPGGYFTGRHLNNALRKVVNDAANPRETLLDYVQFIDEEIKIKRKEFQLPSE